MAKKLSAAAIAKLEDKIQAVTGIKHETTFGIVAPDGSLLRRIKRVDGEWVEVDDQVSIYTAEKLEKAIKSNKRFIIIIGGRGSMKSVGVADIMIHGAVDLGHKVYCLREFQESIAESVHSLLKEEIERLRMTGFRVIENAIFHEAGGEFKYRGLARNPESIKSASGFDRFFCEEAAVLSEESIKNLTPTARNKARFGLPGEIESLDDEDDELENVQMWFVANPRSSADPFSKRFITPFWADILRDGFYEDDLHLIIRMNYTDNPWFGLSGLEQERQYDEKYKSTAMYRHIWLGEFLDDVEDSIIPVEWFNATIDAHIKLGFEPLGAIVVSHDPSDKGDDPKATTTRRGSVVLDIVQHMDVDAYFGMKAACDIARFCKADYFNWDGDGLGATLRDHATSYLAGLKIQQNMFRGSNSVDAPEAIYNWQNKGAGTKNNKTNKETFFNKRSQYCWALRDRFYKTWRAVEFGEYVNPVEMISLSSNIKDMDVLRSEVCRVPLKDNKNGFIQIMSKIEMRAKGISSPNMFDSLMMSLDIPDTIMINNATHRPQPIKRLPR